MRARFYLSTHKYDTYIKDQINDIKKPYTNEHCSSARNQINDEGGEFGQCSTGANLQDINILQFIRAIYNRDIMAVYKGIEFG